MKKEKKIKRYPGGKPFTKDMSHLFYGRKEDLQKLHQLVSLESLVVLYGRSGLGKSSLINAGLIPKLELKKANKCIQFRFSAWTEKRSISPLKATREKLSSLEVNTSTLDKLLPDDKSVWRQVKGYQLANPDDQLVMIFDQFEELFSYPEEQIFKFKKDIAQIWRNQLPKRYEQMLDISNNMGQDLISLDEEDALYKRLNVRILFIIRSDKMHLLDKLSDYLPTVLKNNHELKALQVGGALEAITIPPSLEGTEFVSPQFSYTDTAQKKILDFLKDEDTGLVEALQLQIVCTSFEENVIRNGWKELNQENIGDLEAIVQNYYQNKINSLATVEDRKQAARLLEDGLVDNQRQQRLTLHESQIQDLFEIEQGLLDQLVDIHILRREIDQNGGYNYELSHDTLIAPALAAKEVRVREEEREERLQKEKELEEERKKRRKAVILSRIAGILAIVAIGLMVSQYFQRLKLNESQASEHQLNIELEAKILNANRLKQEADDHRITAEKDRAYAVSQQEEALLQKAKAEAQRIEAVKKRIEADSAKAAALSANISMKIAQDEASILQARSTAELELSKGERAYAIIETLKAYEQNKEDKKTHLLVRKLARTPMPLDGFFTVPPQIGGEKIVHPPNPKVIATTQSIYFPKNDEIRGINADQVLFSNDGEFLLTIKMNQDIQGAEAIKEGSLSYLMGAWFEVYEAASGKRIASFPSFKSQKIDLEHRMGNSSIELTKVAIQENSEIEEGFITPWASCFWSLSDDQKSVLSLDKINSFTFNAPSFSLHDSSGQLLSYFGDFTKRASENAVFGIEEAGLLVFKSRGGKQLLALSDEYVRKGSGQFIYEGVCRAYEHYIRMSDWRNIEIATFNFRSSFCSPTLAPYSYTRDSSNVCSDIYPLTRQYMGIDPLTYHQINQGYQFFENEDKVLLWDKDFGWPNLWSLDELRIADFLPGEYHGLSFGDRPQFILTKKDTNIYVWDFAGNLITYFTGLQLFYESNERYVLQNVDGTYDMIWDTDTKRLENVEGRVSAFLEDGVTFTNATYSDYEEYENGSWTKNYVLQQGSFSGARQLKYVFVGSKYNNQGQLVLRKALKSVTSTDELEYNRLDSIPDLDYPEDIDIYPVANRTIYIEKGGERIDEITMNEYIHNVYIQDDVLIIILESKKVKIFKLNYGLDIDEYFSTKNPEIKEYTTPSQQ